MDSFLKDAVRPGAKYGWLSRRDSRTTTALRSKRVRAVEMEEVDDTNDASTLAGTSSSNPPGSTNTYTDLAAEAQRAVAHFGITDLANSNIIIAQPPNFSDPNALSSGYCAFHDYTQPGLEGGIYNNIQPGIAWTNRILRFTVAPPNTPATTTQARKNTLT